MNTSSGDVIYKLNVLYSSFINEPHKGLLTAYKCHEMSCVQKNICEVKLNEETFLTPFMGTCNEEGNVLIVGEAPSTVNGTGVFVGGMFDDVGKNGNRFKDNISHINWIRDFAKTKYNTTPFFVDAIKCGVSRQKPNYKDKLKKRERCIAELLIKEIEIINPTIILCMGGNAFRLTKNAIKYYGNTGSAYKLAKLLHYSPNNNPKHHNKYAIIQDIWEDDIKYKSVLVSSNRKLLLA